MALPGKDNPFLKGLTEKAPISGLKKQKIFEKISLATGTKVSHPEDSVVSVEKSEQANITLKAAITEDSDFLVTPPLPSSDFRTSSEQQVNIEGTSKKQEVTTREQPRNYELLTGKQLDNERVNNQENSSQATNSKLKSCDNFIIHRVKGHKRKILAIVYSKTRPDDNYLSDPIDTEVFISELKTDMNSVKTVIGRLVKIDKCLQVVDSYSSPSGGWRIFRMPESIYRALDRADAAGFLNESKQTLRKPVNNQVNKPDNKQVNNDFSSSGINISPTTTTSAPSIPDKKELPQEWKDLDYSCLSSIGFRECHIQQIFESGKATAEMVQDSIDELSHDLKAGNHGMRSPLLVLLKQLRSKGEPYTAITPGYVSDQIKYERKQLEELERRNRELIELRQKQESLKNLPGELEKEARFQAWCKSLPSEQKKAIAPRATIEGSEMQLGLLRAHWETQINKTTN